MSQHKLDKYRILKCPVTTESAMKKIEEINTLVGDQHSTLLLFSVLR